MLPGLEQRSRTWSGASARHCSSSTRRACAPAARPSPRSVRPRNMRYRHHIRNGRRGASYREKGARASARHSPKPSGRAGLNASRPVDYYASGRAGTKICSTPDAGGTAIAICVVAWRLSGSCQNDNIPSARNYPRRASTTTLMIVSTTTTKIPPPTTGAVETSAIVTDSITSLKRAAIS